MSMPPGSQELSAEQRALFELLLRKEGLEPSSLLLPQARSGDEAPLSFVQEQLWFLDRLHPRDPAYNVPLALRLEGPVEVEALQRSLSQLAERHEVLRTAFLEGAQPVQKILSPETVPITLIDLRSLPAAQRDTTARELAIAEAQEPFDLSAGRLLRVTLVRLEESVHHLLITLHHIISDVWSMNVLVRELAALYAALLAGRSAVLPRLPVQYRDFAHWQRSRLQGGHLESLRAFWVKQMAGCPPLLQLPTDRPRPASQSSRGAREYLYVPPHLTQGLRALSQQLGASLFMTTLAVFKALLYRYTGQQDLAVGSPMTNRKSAEVEGLIGFFVDVVVLRTKLAGNLSFRELLARVRDTALAAYAHQDMPFSLLVDALGVKRDPSYNPVIQASFALLDGAQPALGLPGVTGHPIEVHNGTAKFDLTWDMWDDGGGLRGSLEYNADLFDAATMARMAGHLSELIRGVVQEPDRAIDELPLLTAAERLELAARTGQALPPPEQCIHHLFEEQARRTPDALAVSEGERPYTYRELDERASLLARRLREAGVGPDVVVGLFVERSLEMVVGLLGILKAGGAYLPLDPDYPQQRLAYVLEDAGVRVLLTLQSMSEQLPPHQARVLYLDTDEQPSGALAPMEAGPANLAYLMYTSGSTGRPQGVLVEHRNVVSFMQAMDEHLGTQPGVWLAVTSISFDISVLELLWTLSRGWHVVLQRRVEVVAPKGRATEAASTREMQFSLFYFACDEEQQDQGNKYRLLMEGARFADRHGFAAVWTPERHFHPFGGLYPNPSVISAALATVTERIALRAGSVVLPLHNPLRVAEEWSVVDNLSRGRVGLAFASGWHADDFILAPDRYAERRQHMLRDLETVRRLWRGEAVALPGGAGAVVDARIHPRPMQQEVPLWLTAAGHVDTFRLAGERGLNVLTHLLGQDMEALGEKLAVYRRAWREAGHPGEGHVTLMIHTFVGTDEARVRQQVRGPFINYLRSSVELTANLARSLGMAEADSLSEKDLEALLEHGFDRYYGRSGLMGTVDACLQTVERLRALGVDELACLIDFGVANDEVLKSLEMLDQVRRRSQAPRARQEETPTLAAQIARHGVTHLQCTPSLARLLEEDAESRAAMGTLKVLLLGGEALPLPLARRLAELVPGEVWNVYGPTEATVWSTLWRVPRGCESVLIGQALANTYVRVLDSHLQPVPTGVSGELFIGGTGVVRGYHHRPELTASRFVTDPSGPAGARLYRTGDRVRRRADGQLEFLGRMDYQVKLRGHRIELLEVEQVLMEEPSVAGAAAAVRAQEGEEARLVAYVVPAPQALTSSGEADVALSEQLKQWQVVWEETYRQSPGAEDPTLQTVGWRSSYTGQPIGQEEMGEWVERTVERIAALGPRRLLEVGCGTGMLLFRLAPRCEAYVGRDFSPGALEHVRQHSARLGLHQVLLSLGSAADISELASAGFDTVVLNSVAQYFPSGDYLLHFLESAVECTVDGGHVFLGDLRSLPLLEAFHASVMLAQAPATGTAQELWQEVRRRVAQEEELVIDPALFHALGERLPRVRAVRILGKQGRFQNEMNCFRYDVVLEVGPPLQREQVAPQGWSGWSLEKLRRELLEKRPPVLALRGLVDARTQAAVQAVQWIARGEGPHTVGQLRTTLAALSREGQAVDPQALFALGEESGYRVEVSPSTRGAPGTLEVLLWRLAAGQPAPVLTAPASPRQEPRRSYINNPLADKLERALLPRLRQHLRERLPEYMVPSAFMFLSELPLTPNGKVDRRALPEPPSSRPVATATFVAPRTTLESQLAALWAELLHLERVGIHDDFFELGGHSLSATQLLFRIRSTLGVELPLGKLLAAPTVARLAQALEASPAQLRAAS
jgi:natural product biosynthesis luciferase-like monooxygenase protein